MVIPLLLHGKYAGPMVLYQPFGPWIVPWWYTAFEQEYRALRDGVGLIDYSTQALIEVRGAERVSFLHRLLTNDIQRLTPGAGCRAALLDASAKLIADLLVLADPESLQLLCALDRATIVEQTLNRYLFTEDVAITNHERQHAVIALQGPRTMEILTETFGQPIALAHSIDHMVIFHEGTPIRIIRYSLINEHGALCILNAQYAEAFWEELRDRGRAHDLQLVGWEALNAARIEAGVPWFGIDMDQTNLLPETGLEQVLVSETKGCYLGQEIVARLRTYGSVSKKLVGILLDGEDVPLAGDHIVSVDSAEVLGSLTSSCASPTLQRPIALGYVKRGAYDPGTRVEIVRSQHRISATVSERPLVPLR